MLLTPVWALTPAMFDFGLGWLPVRLESRENLAGAGSTSRAAQGVQKRQPVKEDE
jgi:hypothetical protein